MKKRGEEEDFCKMPSVHRMNRGASNCDKQAVSLEEVEKISNMLTIYFV